MFSDTHIKVFSISCIQNRKALLFAAFKSSIRSSKVEKRLLELFWSHLDISLHDLLVLMVVKTVRNIDSHKLDTNYLYINKITRLTTQHFNSKSQRSTRTTKGMKSTVVV